MLKPVTFPHRILKVRTVTPLAGQAEPAHDAIWLTAVPFPPGNVPSFMGSIWVWCDERMTPRAPILEITLADGTMRPVNLWASPKFGVRTLHDRSKGWRRIDFTLTLPGEIGDRLAVSAVSGVKDGPLHQVAIGHFVRERGRWRLEKLPAPAHPFTIETAGPADQQVTCFAGGAPKSGTTWMQILLNQHPQVLSVGEGVFTNMIDVDKPRPPNLWFPPNLSGPHLRDFGTGMLIHHLFTLNREVFQCRVAADKTPGNSRLFRELLAMVPDAKLIHCIRHPLDVVISRLHHEYALLNSDETQPAKFVGDGQALRELAPALSETAPLPLSRPDVWPMVVAIIDEWALFQAEALAAAEMAPSQVLISRYEDMLTDGVDAATRVFAHLGVSTDPAIMERCVRAASFDTIKKSALGGENANAFFRKGTARQFETAITAADQERALVHLREQLPTFERLGYEVAVKEAA